MKHVSYWFLENNILKTSVEIPKKEYYIELHVFRTRDLPNILLYELTLHNTTLNTSLTTEFIYDVLLMCKYKFMKIEKNNNISDRIIEHIEKILHEHKISSKKIKKRDIEKRIL